MVDSDKMMEGRAGSGWELLRTKNFGCLFSAGHFPDRRRHEQGALLWFVYELTGSAFKMAIIGLLQPFRRWSLAAHRCLSRSDEEKAGIDLGGSYPPGLVLLIPYCTPWGP